MKTRDIFFGADAKLRSGWRFAAFATSYVLAYLFFVSLAVGAAAYGFGIYGPSLYLVGSIASLIPALILGWVFGKYFEGLPFRALGASTTSGWIKHFLVGSIMGAATLVLGVGIAALFGDLRFTFNNSTAADITRSMLFSFVIFAAASAFEEALFRGYVLQTFTRSGLAWLAILVTSVFFGLVHLDNKNVNWLAAINTSLAGIWFGVAYLKTRDLWFVWGLHLMWNWTQGAIFGIEVSGLTEIVHSPLLKESDHGPAWLTGENYGIEASIACTIALIVSTIVIYFLPYLKPSEEMIELQRPDR